MSIHEVARQLIADADALPGKVGLYFENLSTGEHFGLHEADCFESASVIKLPVYAAIEKLVCEGRAHWDERLVCREADKVPSCGALQFFTGEPEVDLRTLCALMITISDNTATNLLLRRFGLSTLNEQFRAIGLQETRLERLLFDTAASAVGKENRFVPSEVGALLRRLALGQYLSPSVSDEMVGLLRRQQIKHKLQGCLPRGTVVAHKTGEDAGITNDVGIVYAREPFVLCFASNDTDVPSAECYLRQAALTLYHACGGAP